MNLLPRIPSRNREIEVYTPIPYSVQGLGHDHEQLCAMTSGNSAPDGAEFARVTNSIWALASKYDQAAYLGLNVKATWLTGIPT